MAVLSTTEKQILEKLFQMGDGYVLNFSDWSFKEFFRDDVGVAIYDAKYNHASGSKANRMRGFWQASDDATVRKSIEKLLGYIDTQILLGRLKKQDFPDGLISRARNIARRIAGQESVEFITNEREFLETEFGTISIDKLGLDAKLVELLKQRLVEIKKCLSARASLAVVFLCGSSLEGILLGVACARPDLALRMRIS